MAKSSISYRHRYTIVCHCCNKAFNPHRRGQKYCSRDCAVLKREGNRRKNNVMKKCSNCGEAYGVKISHADKSLFCSNKCKHENQRNTGRYSRENNPNWKGGLSFESYPREFNKDLKVRIRGKYNYTCQFCGKKEGVVGKIFDVHHIDYNKNNCSDSNLILLCRGCNTRANYYNRGLWELLYKEMVRLKNLGYESVYNFIES